MELLQYPLALIVTLGVLITFHELGHFIVARWSGVRVVRFSVGFGRPLFSRVDRHGTEFVIAAIPFGGYVRMLDEHEPGEIQMAVPERADDVRYTALSVWWRMAIAAAGPIANFILAIVVYWWLFVVGSTSYAPVLGAAPVDSPLDRAGVAANLEIVSVDGERTLDWQQVNMALARRMGDTGAIELETRRPGAEVSQVISVPITAWHQGSADPNLLGSLGMQPMIPAIVATVLEDGPAARDGQLRQWDLITEVDSTAIEGWSDWVAAVQAAPDQVIEVMVDRSGREYRLALVPEARAAADGGSIGFMGVGAHTNAIEFGPLEAIPRSLSETWDKTLLTLGLLRKMVTGQVSVKNLSSPIMIAKVAGDTARSGWRFYLGLLALLSISLGILNLLPIPILDGGHILFCLAEIVRRKPVSERAQIIGTQIGLVLVTSLLVVAVYNDIMRLL